jgi:hypothetical protein
MNLSSKTVLIPSIALLIGTVFGTGATNAFADDPFKNKVEIEDDTKQKNDCDVDATGGSSLGCSASVSLTTQQINVQGEKNKVDLDFKTKQKNDCDGEASGGNSEVCDAFVNRNIGNINIFPSQS